MSVLTGQRIDIRTSSETEAKSEAKITPQMLQYLHVLQMNANEFDAYIKEAADANPMLEFASDYTHSYDPAGGDAESDPFLHAASFEPEYTRTLEFELKAQLEEIRKRMELTDPVYNLCIILIGNIDEDGYLLAEFVDRLSSIEQIGPEMTNEALSIIQSMSPAGVGARDDDECISIQMARGVKISLRPGQDYSAASAAQTVYPDIYITGTDSLTVKIDPRHEPVLELSGQYLRMLEETEDAETRAYLRKKKEQAEWLFNCIESRYNTLRAVSEAIAELQKEFLTQDDALIKPVTLKDIASAANVHESTVSRTIRDKYVSTDKGTYPLAAFVPRARSSNADTLSYADIVKRMIREIIYGEDKSHPVSDQKISDKLAEAGYSVSRRAVAKYRTQLGIPNTQARR